MNITTLANAAAESLKRLITDAGDDIHRLIENCDEESQRTGKPVTPKLVFSIAIEGEQAATALSFGIRTKREESIVIDDHPELPGITEDQD